MAASTWPTSVDFPEPETPVTAVNVPSGKRTVSRSRLCRVTSYSVSHEDGDRSAAGRMSARCPNRYRAVADSATSFSPDSGPL